MSRRHVAILGAGAVGAASAIEALRAGWRVTVVDPGPSGAPHAASYGNAGWLSSHSVIPPATPGVWKQVPRWLADPLGPLAVRWRHLPRAAPWLARYLASGWTPARLERTAQALRTLLADAPALHRGLAREAGVDRLIEQRGVLHVWRDREDFEAEALPWGIRHRLGVRWTALDAAALRAAEPDLHPRYRFGVHVAEAGSCRDPGAYVAALAAHARAHGADRWTARAVGFRLQAGRLRAVRLDDGSELACDAAVVSAGARSGALAAAAGSPVWLETERGYHVVLPGAAAGPRTPVMAADCKMIVNATDTGLRAAGQVEIAGPDAAPDWRRAAILRDHLRGMFPGLPADLPDEAFVPWMGHRPSLPDGLPVLGPARASRDIVLAFGHGHVGLGGSARTGRLVAQLLAGQPPEIALAPFDPARPMAARGRHG